jgi:ribosomal protein L32
MQGNHKASLLPEMLNGLMPQSRVLTVPVRRRSIEKVHTRKTRKAQTMASPRYCGNCGQGLREGARFCPSCGGVLHDRILQAQPGIAAQTGVTPANIMAAVAPPAPPADPPGPEANAERVPGSFARSGRPAGGDSEPVPEPRATITGLVPASRPGQGTVSGWEAVPRREPSTGSQQPASPPEPPGSPRQAFPAGPDDPALQPAAPASNRARWATVAGIVVVVLGVGAGVAFAVHSSDHSSAGRPAGVRHTTVPSAAVATAPAATTAPAASTAPLATTSVPAGQQAATSLSKLLAQSGADRSQVTRAVGDVSACDPNLSHDEAVFTNAAGSRHALLQELASLPDRPALPARMLQDLTTAWQASGQADSDFAAWTQDEISQGCSTDVRADPNYQAATEPDDQATRSKMAFVSIWKPIASQYGLPQYQYNEI